jgi:hypothetical protein
MLYDLYENPASKDLKHCLSDFAVNALDVLYAYDGRVADEAILAQGVYGGNQWTVTNFTENKDNSSQIISDKDISIVSKITETEDQLKLAEAKEECRLEKVAETEQHTQKVLK